MKRIIVIALAATFAAMAFGQTKSPKDIYTEIRQFETTSYQNAPKPFTAKAYQDIHDQVLQKVRDALKDVDPAKVDPKDAYDWAKLYSMVDEHKTVCDLTHAYLSSNPDPEQRFQDQMLMMQSCNSLGEADMLKQTATSVKPVSSQDNMAFAQSAPDYVDTIASKEGNAEGLKVLDRIQREIKLPDPMKTAQERLDNSKNAPQQTAGAPAITLGGGGTTKSPQTDDEKLKLYASQAKQRNDSIEFDFANERAKLLQGEGKKDKALSVLQDFAQTPDLAPGTKHMLDMTITQVGLTGTPELALKADQTVGTFTGLDSLKGKVVLVDFFAHWCGPCMASVPSMVSMYGELKPQGLEIVGVTQMYGFFGQDRKLAPDQEFSKLQGMLTEKNMTWPVIVGPKDNSSEYGVWGIPQTILIDKKGMIRNIWVGYDPAQEETIKSAVEKLLKE